MALSRSMYFRDSRRLPTATARKRYRGLTSLLWSRGWFRRFLVYAASSAIASVQGIVYRVQSEVQRTQRRAQRHPGATGKRALEARRHENLVQLLQPLCRGISLLSRGLH